MIVRPALVAALLGLAVSLPAPGWAQGQDQALPLAKSKLLSDVNLLFSDEYKRTRETNSDLVRKFHIEMKVNPDADLRRLGDQSASLDAEPSVTH